MAKTVRPPLYTPKLCEWQPDYGVLSSTGRLRPEGAGPLSIDEAVVFLYRPVRGGR
jgi:hypothetical protein